MARVYRTHTGAWVVAAALVAAGLGFVPLLSSGKGDPPTLWGQAADLWAGRRLESVATFAWDALLIAVGATVGGWLLQAVAEVLGLLPRRSGGSGSMRQPAPRVIRGRHVLAYTQIDGRHRVTGRNERRWVDGTGAEILYGPAAGLAICAGGQGDVVLIGCAGGWQPMWETWCTSAEVAEDQAEFEYEGVSRTWVRPGT